MEENKSRSDSTVGVRRPLNVIVVGGSLGGLMAAFLLKRQGHNVTLLEQAESSTREGLAAGIGFSQHVKHFFENELGVGDELGIEHAGFEVVGPDLEVRHYMERPMRMTSWDTAYYQIRAKFDGLKSSHVPSPSMIATEGEGTYKTGKKVLKVQVISDQMVATFEDSATGAIEESRGDICIAADGANSLIRRQLNPSLEREEPGYVIWRGSVPTGELTQTARDKLEGRALICPAHYNYGLTYTIPGEHGSTVSGTRHINFVWYFWPTNSSIKDIMTDTDGHTHRTTVPKGKLRPEVWNAQVRAAKGTFPPELYEVVSKIKQPFVSIVSSISAPQASYFNNRLFLIGDALTQVQPNIGMGTNLAAHAAMRLAEAIGNAGAPIDVEATDNLGLDPAKLEEWEQGVLSLNEITRVSSVAFASWYLNGWHWVGWYYARWMWKQFWLSGKIFKSTYSTR